MLITVVVNSEAMPLMSALIGMGTESISVCQVFNSLFKLVAVRQETFQELTQMEMILDVKHLLPTSDVGFQHIYFQITFMMECMCTFYSFVLPLSQSL